MTRSTEARSSAIDYDGKGVFIVNSPVMSLSSAAANQGSFVAPCDGTIVAAVANLIQAGTGGTNHLLKFGDRATASAFGVTTFTTGSSTGVKDLLADLTVTKTVTKGQVIEFNTDGGATSGGLVAATLVIAPNED